MYQILLSRWNILEWTQARQDQGNQFWLSNGFIWSKCIAISIVSSCSQWGAPCDISTLSASWWMPDAGELTSSPSSETWEKYAFQTPIRWGPIKTWGSMAAHEAHWWINEFFFLLPFFPTSLLHPSVPPALINTWSQDTRSSGSSSSGGPREWLIC